MFTLIAFSLPRLPIDTAEDEERSWIWKKLRAWYAFRGGKRTVAGAGYCAAATAAPAASTLACTNSAGQT